MATKTELQSDLRRIQQEIAKLQKDLAQLETDVANSRANPALADLVSSQEATVQRTKDKIAALQQRAADVEAQIAAIPDEPPAQSAAADVANSANGGTQNPAPPATATGRLTTTEAQTLAQNTETGTNPPVKTLAETQSVAPTTPTTYYENDGTASEGRPEPAGAAGVGAKSEDGATATNTKQVLSNISNQPFQPKDNVLDQYASYTYNIGWYLLTPKQYSALQTTAKPAISQYNLLMQSGGAPSTVSGVQPSLTDGGAVSSVSASAGRNPFFGLDYYLDNVEITSVIVGKGTNRAANEASIKFTVTEPANITLINNLVQAVGQVYKDTKIPWSTAYYALVIRFYGYDETGNIVQASNGDNNNAIVQKIIPFKISKIEFSVSSRLVEYHVECVGIPYNIGFGSNLGVIKDQIELSGATVKDFLTKGVEPASPTDDGRQTTPAPKTPSTPKPGTVGALPVAQQAAIAAGTDYNLVNEDGMAFGGGGL
jgi:hypothetical protein